MPSLRNSSETQNPKPPGRFDFDLIIIGGGSGGYAAARTAAGAGLRTALIEGGKEVGGLCILRGCMPTKALLFAAEVRHITQHGACWGMTPGKAPFDWDAVLARKDGLIKEFAEYRVEQLNRGKFEFMRAQARLTGPHSVALSDGRVLTAAHFVISTGSVVASAPLPHLAETGYLTSDDVLTLPKLPRSMIVLGGGSVAVELAQFLARFDVEITLIQRGQHLLKDTDPDAARVLESVFRREGIQLFTRTTLLEAARTEEGKSVVFLHEGKRTEVAADEILFALGRSPNTASLDLEKAGVAMEEGRIVTNDLMQTNVPHIFAAGDCTARHEIVHIAVQQGEAAAHNIAHPGQPRRLEERLIVQVVFTEPQIATVGLTENEAKARGIACMVATYPFADHGKSMIMEAKDGFVKLLADPATGEILGGCCAGPLGGELIHEIVVAMAGRMTVRQLAAVPHYHPTLAEIWTYPAEELAERIPS